MEETNRVIEQSNHWYNDGLEKAEVRDLSGAVVSLKKSLEYNEKNINARNLLGLIYYTVGDISEALIEWKLSKKIQNEENLADYYLAKVYETPGELDAMNAAVKKYNQCLNYCKQDGKDYALIQLKKVVGSHPSYLRALQLLAMLYLSTDQYAKARPVLRQALEIDKTNETTLYYQKKLNELHQKKAAKMNEGRKQNASYTLNNEAAIKPAQRQSQSIKENLSMSTIVNILIGLIVGAAAVWFLVIPAVNQSQADKLNKEVVKYSDQIATKNAEISALTKELEGYKAASAEVETVKKNAEEAKVSYDALFNVYRNSRKNYNKEEIALQLQAINKDALSDDGKVIYDEIYSQVVIPVCQKKYRTAQKNFKGKNYEAAIPLLEFILSYDERYEGGNVLMMLGESYLATGRTEEARTIYQKAVELFPDTEVERDAGNALLAIPSAPETPEVFETPETEEAPEAE